MKLGAVRLTKFLMSSMTWDVFDVNGNLGKLTSDAGTSYIWMVLQSWCTITTALKMAAHFYNLLEKVLEGDVTLANGIIIFKATVSSLLSCSLLTLVQSLTIIFCY